MDPDRLDGLMRRIALRDRRAFGELYDETSGFLFAQCLRLLRDQGEAEEALQESYIKIWRKADDFARGDAPPLAWLITVTRNTAIDRLRRMRPMPMDDEWMAAQPDPSASPEDSAIDASAADQLRHCLEELEEKQADVVRRAFFSGRTYAELAQALETPLGTVKSWIRRSLSKLRQCLDTGDARERSEGGFP